jgi:hypothetical protein
MLTNSASSLRVSRAEGILSAPGDRAQRKPVLGALALGMPDVPPAEFRRVYRADDPSLVLGTGFLREASSPSASHNAAVRALAFKWIRVLW